MVVLEETGYLRKEYFSSGKVPTKQGYELYIQSLMDKCRGCEELKKKLLEIFRQRHDSIDSVLDECANLISGFIDLPIVLVKTNKLQKEVLKKIDLVSMSPGKLMIYLITSSGEMIKDFIYLKDLHSKKIKDLFVSIRLLNEQLQECPISLIGDRLKIALEKLKKEVCFYEFVYEVLITKIIFEKLVNKKQTFNKSIYNPKALANHKDINSALVLELLDKYSTFATLEYNYLKTGNTLFNLEGELENGFALATTDIDLDKANHKLSVVGPMRMNYSLIKYLLDFLSEKIKKMVK